MTETADILERVIRSRRSVRRFDGAAVAAADLERIVNAALFAPSAANQQPWHFAVVTGKARIERMGEAVRAEVEAVAARIKSAAGRERFAAYAPYLTFFEGAGAVICVFVESYRGMLERLLDRYAPEAKGRLEVAAAEQSVAAAVENLLLMAHALGYGGCWATGPLIAAGRLQEGLTPPGDWRLMALVALGRPVAGTAGEVPARRRREETVSYHHDDAE